MAVLMADERKWLCPPVPELDCRFCSHLSATRSALCRDCCSAVIAALADGISARHTPCGSGGNRQRWGGGGGGELIRRGFRERPRGAGAAARRQSFLLTFAFTWRPSARSPRRRLSAVPRSLGFVITSRGRCVKGRSRQCLFKNLLCSLFLRSGYQKRRDFSSVRRRSRVFCP